MYTTYIQGTVVLGNAQYVCVFWDNLKEKSVYVF